MTRAMGAFQKAYEASDAVHQAQFETIEARQSRYVQYWAFYENQAYSNVHSWAQSYRHQYALYKYIRSLYNPAYRLGSFYATHMFGGPLDKNAEETGAIPIMTENEKLRPAIAELWKWSNMSTLKDVISLRGTVEGDVLLSVVDDVEKERVYLKRVDPGLVTDATFDPWGNIKGYTFEEQRADPIGSGSSKYKLVVSRSGDGVVYQTFKGNSPFGWNGQPSTWIAPYSFVPLVLIKHHDVGLDWGWSELHPMRSKVHEVDELASMVSDHIRKHMNPAWLGKGMKPQTLTLSGAQADESGGTGSRPQPGREEMRVLWGASENASLDAVIAKLDIANSLKHIEGLLEEIERDYPELQADIWSTGATSGRALRVARQRVESKAYQRREGYDSGLVRAQQMAISIGGFRGYEGYEGFGLDSFDRGDLDHSIAARRVFAADPMDDIEEAKEFWTAAEKAVNAGLPLAVYLKEMGWDDERITSVRLRKDDLSNMEETND